ncbi:MAG: type VI secretion system tip protein VgrG [Deltaproteobacteria bacterium]|nr:type VI secretion system tip protein VgrG [Deltaproteobacteria bacterium]
MDAPTSAGILPEVTTELVIRAEVEGHWTLLEMVLREGLSRLYEARLVVGTDDPYPELGRLLGERVTARIRRGETQRQLHGIVCRAEELERHRDGSALVALWVVPELWFLGKRKDSRIFAHEPTPRVVRQVLDAAGLYAGDRLSLRLADTAPHAHAVREYCVQYQETDLAFFMRLLEEEGSTFYFVHDGEQAERLVIVDGDRASVAETYVQLDNGAAGSEVRLVTTDRAQLEPVQTIQRFACHAEVQSNAVVLREHDFTNHRQPGLWTSERRDAAARRELAVYEHPSRLVFEGAGADVSGSGPTVVDHIVGTLRGASAGRLSAAESDTLGETVRAAIPAAPYPPLPRHGGNTGGPLAQLRLEEHRQRTETFEGEGIVATLGPGHWFDLAEHPRNALDRQYLVTWVEHELRAGEWAESERRPRYVNRFHCIPRTVPYRPARTTERPRILGTQTGTVVGGPGDEMHVDAYGRVRVQFHWDRQHHLDEHAPAGRSSIAPAGAPDPAALGGGGVSALAALATPAGDPRSVCWVRCAQAWAGPHWGSVFIPRVGMEVVVTFLEGDPDRPLVVGCVYNSANPPPYPLPAQYHRSTIMSRSIPSPPGPGGRVGFNELRFDDLAGQEQIYLHAEKDLTEVVREHHETYVGGSHDVEVRRNQTLQVGANQHESVGHDQAVSVGRHQGTGVGGNRELRVRGVELRVAGRGRFTQADVFDGELISGGHLHYVVPAGATSVESRPEVAAILSAVQREAAAMGGPPAPSQSDENAGGGDSDAAGDEGGSDRPSVDWDGDGEGGGDAEGDGDGSGDGGGDGGGPIEIWIVEGDRRVRVTGTERVQIGGRHTEISGDDQTVADGRVIVTADMVGMAATGGTTKGLALLSEDDDRLRLFRGGDQELLMLEEGVGIRNTNQQYLTFDSEAGTEIFDETGPVNIMQGAEGDEAGLEIEDGYTTIYGKGDHCYVEVQEERVKIRATGEIDIRSDGGASIKLKSDGSIEIRGTAIDVYGPFKTH